MLEKRNCINSQPYLMLIYLLFSCDGYFRNKNSRLSFFIVNYLTRDFRENLNFREVKSNSLDTESLSLTLNCTLFITNSGGNYSPCNEAQKKFSFRSTS